MTEPLPAELEKVPSIGISYQYTLQNGQRQLVLQSFVERECSKEALNGLLDKMRAAGERQQAYSMIFDLERALEREHELAEKQSALIAKEDAQIKREWENGNRRGDVRLSQQQLQKQQQAYQVAEDIKDRIKKLIAAKQEWEAKLAP